MTTATANECMRVFVRYFCYKRKSKSEDEKKKLVLRHFIENV